MTRNRSGASEPCAGIGSPPFESVASDTGSGRVTHVPNAVLRRGHVHVSMQSDQGSSAAALARLALRWRVLWASRGPRGLRQGVNQAFELI